jgi:hypothetical protein
VSPRRGQMSRMPRRGKPADGRVPAEPPKRKSPCPKCQGKKGRMVAQNTGPDRWADCGFCGGEGEV